MQLVLGVGCVRLVSWLVQRGGCGFAVGRAGNEGGFVLFFLEVFPAKGEMVKT